jgi:hypothetical protein
VSVLCLDDWLTARYRLFTVGRSEVRGVRIAHPPWRLRRAALVVRAFTVASAAGVELWGPPPLAHFAEEMETRVWAPKTRDRS